MTWHDGGALFIGGAFLANFFPHFVTGVTRRSFPSPFAKPPFRGLSSPAVNVIWGLFNLAVAYVLLVLVANVDLRGIGEAGVSAIRARFSRHCTLCDETAERFSVASPVSSSPVPFSDLGRGAPSGLRLLLGRRSQVLAGGKARSPADCRAGA